MKFMTPFMVLTFLLVKYFEKMPILFVLAKYWQSSRKQNTQKITVSKFSTIFQNCDCYGKDAIFLHFFQQVFSKFAKLDIFKMSKKQFSKHFCIFIFYFLGSLLKILKY